MYTYIYVCVLSSLDSQGAHPGGQEVKDEVWTKLFDFIMATSLGANRCWKRWSHSRWWPTDG